jgi:hypothetical protein
MCGDLASALDKSISPAGILGLLYRTSRTSFVSTPYTARHLDARADVAFSTLFAPRSISLSLRPGDDRWSK